MMFSLVPFGIGNVGAKIRTTAAKIWIQEIVIVRDRESMSEKGQITRLLTEQAEE